MDYKSFVEAMRQQSGSDEEKRRARIAQIRAQQQQQAAAEQQKRDNGPSNPLEFIGELGKGIFDAATSIPRKVVTTLQAAGNEKEVLSQLSDLDAQYKRGEINKAMLEEKVNNITKDIIGNQIKVTDAGVVEGGAAARQDSFTKNVVGAGVDTASVIPAVRGVQFGLRAGGELAKEGVGQFAKRSLVNNAQQAAVYGTADTANDFIQGRQVTPGSVAMNYALPAVGGAVGDVAGVGLSKGFRAARDVAQSYQALPRSVREGGSIQVPGRAPTEDLASAVQPSVPATEPTRFGDVNRPGVTATDRGVPLGEVDPITGLRNNAAEAGTGVTTKTREQMKVDNMPQRSFGKKFYEQFIDQGASLKDYAKAYAEKTGKTLAPEDDPHVLFQLRAGAADAALTDLKGVADDLSYIRSQGLTDKVREFGIANQVVNDRSGNYSSSIVDAERAKLDAIQKSMSPEELQQVKAGTQNIIDSWDRLVLRPMVDNGMLDEPTYAAIKESNPNYFTSFNLEKYIDQNQRRFARSNSVNTPNNPLKSVKGIADDAVSIEDPFESLARHTVRVNKLIADKKVVEAITRLQDTLPELGHVVRDPVQVTERMALSAENKELAPVIRQVDRIIKSDSASVRKLQSQIDSLEKQGYNISLKNGGERMAPGDMTVAGLGGDVATSKAGTDKGVDFVADINGNLRGNDARKIARNGKIATDQRAVADNLLGDNTGEAGLILNKEGQEAARKSFQATQRNKDIIKQGGSADAQPVYDSKLGSKDTASFVRNLIENNSQAQINKLKKMVGTRDVKIAKILDDISNAKQDYDELSDIAKSNRQAIQEKADVPVPEGYEAISDWHNGIKQNVAVPQYIADVLKGKNDVQLGVLEDMLRIGAKPFKSAATVFSPAFLVKNSIRDTGTHWLTSQNISKAERLALVPYAKRWAQGFFDAWTDSDFAQRVTKAGGGSAGVFTDVTDPEKMIARAAENISGEPVTTPKNMFLKAAKMVDKYNPIFGAPYRNAMTKVGRSLEYAPRYAEARAAIENGLSDTGAALATRQAIGDLQQGGTLSRLLNATTPFFNSILQGNKRIVDAATENPAAFGAMVTAGIAVPAATLYLWNRTAYPDVLNNIPEYDRENNFIIILGDAKDKDGRYSQVIKIPKNDAAKVFGNNLEAGLAAMAGERPADFTELFLKTLGYAQPVQLERDGKLSADAIVGSAPIVSNPLFRTPVELTTNHSFFTGNDIVPSYMQGLDAKDQVTDSTAPLDALAAQVGISPQQSAIVRQGVSAGLLNGDNPVDQITKVVKGTNGTRGSNEFYSLRNTMQDERKRASNAVNKAIAANDIAAAQDIAQRYNAKFKQTFDPWVKQYGSQATPEMRNSFLSLRLVLNSGSIKQRRNNLK